MVRLLAFLIKAGLLLAAVIWLAENPGTIEINWLDYQITMHVGLFIAVVMLAMLLAIFIFSLIRFIVHIPEKLTAMKRKKDEQKGYQSIIRGLSCLAAGDSKGARKQIGRIRKMVPANDPLSLFVQAQYHRINNENEKAAQIFSALSEDEDAAFLGIRGLLHYDLAEGRYKEALVLAEKALKDRPGQGWIARLAYDLQIREGKIDAAHKTLKKLERLKIVEQEKIRSDKTALYILQGDNAVEAHQDSQALGYYKKAFSLTPAFAPAAQKLAAFYQQQGDFKKARDIITKTWKQEPHPDLIPLWEALIPKRKARDPLAQLSWVKDLIALNDDCARAYLKAGQYAAAKQLWGEARHYYESGITKHGTADLYKALADLEQKLGTDEAQVLTLRDKARNARPARVWVCRETGRIYDSWQPLAAPHMSFNTIEWGYPRYQAALAVKGGAADDFMLDKPQYGLLKPA